MSEQRQQSGKNSTASDDLGRMLRAADPAGGHDGLDPVARAEMRRRVTDAAETHAAGRAWVGAQGGRPGWLVPALSAAALVTIVGLALWSFTGAPARNTGAVADRGVPAPETSTSAQSVPEPVVPDATVPSRTEPAIADAGPTPPPAVDEPSADEPEVTPMDVGVAPAISDPATRPTATTVADTPSPPDREPRTLQFVAPRGTRIIWTLDPNYESPIAGQEARQE